MTDLLLLIIIGFLYVIYKNQKTEKKDSGISYQEVLPSYLHKKCEIIVKKPLVQIDVLYNTQGVLMDYDDVWILLEMEEKNKKVRKAIRIDNINTIKEVA